MPVESLSVAGRLPANTSASMGTDGRLHLAALDAVAEPASLVALRAAVEAMMPRVDLPEVVLEVFSWTGADAAFTSITRRRPGWPTCGSRLPRCWWRTAATSG
ncbi:hypothetical protein GCM10022226_80640 [Sphaerisporangium flaviroseum]|uniref:Uncharacterized protein n=1 Tax=Sphaerisporangium flaviroseum TaxID=509199 RepID=A0ABP7JJS0_9ACTN